LSDLGSTLAYWVDLHDPEEMQKIRWCPSTAAGSVTRVQLAERYARATGRDISRMPYYLAFARFKVAVIIQQIYFRYAQGLTKDARFARMGELVAIMMRAAMRSMEEDTI
jgi:aminoglycoside phosphotransferase (APT) family kinase protein